MEDTTSCDRRDGVTKLELLERLEQFATLPTRLDFLSVTDFPLASHVCHPSHVDTVNKSDSCQSSQALAGIEACFLWLSTAIKEGHLEPSQPLMGKVIGWPQRMVNISSLWIDFHYWCCKNKISKNEIPEQWVFYEILDRIFIRHADKYEIPTLERCRIILNTLRQYYECD